MNFVTKEPINKGWSRDKKYCVTDENGTRYLLRVSDTQQHDTKQSEFNMIKQVASFGVPNKWQLSDKLFDVATEAVSDDQSQRQQSIRQFKEEWEAGV